MGWKERSRRVDRWCRQRRQEEKGGGGVKYFSFIVIRLLKDLDFVTVVPTTVLKSLGIFWKGTFRPRHLCGLRLVPGQQHDTQITIVIRILGSYIALYHIPRGVSKRSVYFLQGMWSYILKYETYPFIALCNGLQGAVAQYAANQTRNTGADPFSLR